MEELISIIVPVYRVEKYLSRCIDSIIAQTYKTLEIILVDDGSPDGCPEICDSYAERDNRVYVIHKKNGGLSDARNAGIEAAHGKYLGFVDSDDYIHPKMYQRLWEKLKKEDADAAMCDIEKVYDMSPVFHEIAEDETEIFNGIQAVKNILDKQLHVISVISCGKLYKAELFEKVRFPFGKLHEDEFTTYRLYYKCSKVVLLHGKYYYYFQRQDSIMGKSREVFSYDALEAYEQMADFFKQEENREIFYLIKYKYLYMLKEYASGLKKSGSPEDLKTAKGLDKKFHQEYVAYGGRIRGLKRKARLWLYRWFAISI